MAILTPAGTSVWGDDVKQTEKKPWWYVAIWLRWVTGATLLLTAVIALIS
ncbi:MAG: hypothetical protein WAV15_02465 [Minisyncoccia bacterium]